MSLTRQEAWQLAGKRLEVDTGWQRLDPHRKAYARMAVAMVLRGVTEPDGVDPILHYALRNAPVDQVEVWVDRLHRAAAILPSAVAGTP